MKGQSGGREGEREGGIWICRKREEEGRERRRKERGERERGREEGRGEGGIMTSRTQ